MNFAVVILFAMIAPTMMQCQMDSPQWRSIFKRVRNVIFKGSEKTGSKSGLRKATGFNKIQAPLDDRIPFPCNLTRRRSLSPPESVHRLRPGDIDVVGALGDSLTAANGAAATTLIEVLTENRGLSPIIGGQGDWRTFLTLPNILKEFNPNLIGYSLKDGLGHHKSSQFNVAEPAAMSQDIYFMAKELVRRMKNDERVDFQKHWKLVTIFIGANDFCSNNCYMSPFKFKSSAEIHRQELTATLDYLRDNLPRTLVSVVLMPNLELLTKMKGLPPHCDIFRMVACSCLFGLARKFMLKENLLMQEEWRRVQTEVANDKRYQRKSDFAVVLQPFAGQLNIPNKENGKTDTSFLSADCFHLSQKGYAKDNWGGRIVESPHGLRHCRGHHLVAALHLLQLFKRLRVSIHNPLPFQPHNAANAVWNNMLEPVGRKSETWADLYTKFLCPTERHPYIYTHGNSF